MKVFDDIASCVRKLKRERAAYKWAYEYLQSRMESIGRHSWAHDCDGEIAARIESKDDPTSDSVSGG